ncbi:hypothetical protein V2A60_000641 [Cordyceps javanica]
MEEASESNCTTCGPQEIYIWNPDGGDTHLQSHISSTLLQQYHQHVLLIFADANTIRECVHCKDKFSANFNIPQVWWEEHYRKGNGYFGWEDVLNEAEEVQGHVTWSHFLTKQVRLDKTGDKNGHKYEWIKVNTFTQWLKSGRQVVLSFEQKKGKPDTKRQTKESIRRTLLGSLATRELKDPFWVYYKLLSFILELNDRSIWSIRDCVRDIELYENDPKLPKKDVQQPEDQTRKPKNGPDYRSLHDLARHAIHIAEVLTVTRETIQHITAQHRDWVDEVHNSRMQRNYRFIKNVQRRLLFYEQTISSFHHRMLSTKDRLTNEINLSFNKVAQNHSESAANMAVLSLADNSVMKKIAFLTAAFLPATFVSAIFSTSFFNFNPEANRWAISNRFWVYWAVAIPLTIVMPIVWVLLSTAPVWLAKAREMMRGKLPETFFKAGNNGKQSGSSVGSANAASPV